MTQQRHALTDEQWQRMAPHLPPVLGRPGRNDRLFIDGVLWIAKTGSPWRDLPAHLGAGLPTLCPLERAGAFQCAVSSVARARLRAIDGGLDFLQSTSGERWGSKKKGPQAIGISRGGLNTKIHAVCDALGNPLRFKLTAGNKSDTPELIGLIQGLPGQELLADKAYDSDAIVQEAMDKGMEVVIPPKANRKEKRAFDALKYRARHLVENLFQRMKVYRRVATRYEKLDSRFLSIIYLVGAMKWLH